MTETPLIERHGEDGVEGEEGELKESRGIAWENMNSVVQNNKEGPWYTQADSIRDAEERRPDDPDYDPSTIHIPKPE